MPSNIEFNIASRLKLLFHFIILLITFTSCNSNSEYVEESLSFSGNNRKELEKVITHFKETGEEEKLKAVYFLFENMTPKFHYEGIEVTNYKNIIEQLSKLPDSKKEFFLTIGDSIKHTLDEPSGDAKRVSNLTTLNSNLLIQHIDAAFKAWDLPWAKTLSFEEFCEYILPYKLVDEKPELWNKPIQENYAIFLDTVKKKSDLYSICLYINEDLKRKFHIRSIPIAWDLNFRELNAIKSGKCFHATQYTTYIMRSLGVPVTMDFTPYWENMNGGHEWNALIYKNKSIPFVGSESDPGKTKIDLAFQRKRPKVYRHTFKIQRESIALENSDEEIPEFFKDCHLLDVTSQYVPTSSINVKPYKNLVETKTMYLCVFNRQQWKPVAWSRTKNSLAAFDNMGKSIVYLPSYFYEGKIVAASPPVLLKDNGETSEIIFDKNKKTDLNVLKKGPVGPSINPGQTYELFYWDKAWVSLGKRIATDKVVKFNNIPSEGLYWITSSDKKSNERIFTVQNGIQEWW